MYLIKPFYRHIKYRPRFFPCVIIVLVMNSENDIFPIFLQLIEQRGDKTENLVAEIKRLSERFNIYDDVILSGIIPSNTSATENALIYQINTTPTSNSPKSGDIIDFLESIFQKMFDKYPSYVEPIH